MTAFLRSMSGRVFLILLVGIVASASLTWWLASGERKQAIGQFHEARVIEQSEQYILTLDAIPATSRSTYLATSRRSGLITAELAQNPGEAAAQNPSGLARALSDRLGSDYKIVSLPIKQDECPAPRNRHNHAFPSGEHIPCEAMGVTLRDGTRLRMTALLPRPPTPSVRSDLIAYLALFLLSIGLLAYVVARMTMRPLKQMAQAAKDLGRDIDHPPLVQQGASEIRQAIAAFNVMQARIRQNIRQRTQILAAITHDLQTPLTRLRLRLEKVPDPALREKLIEDLSATQALVREGLELARSMDSAEPMQPLDLDSLLDSVCSDAGDAGQNVTLHGGTGATVMARPSALQRCFNNLIDNALKYGRFADVAARREAIGGRSYARIVIRDGGPGIAPDQLQHVFEPFYRVETSRSRETGGTGLGLTIARNIAEQHGVTIELANHPEGGLAVTLLLPVCQEPDSSDK
jgi:signal transduction histidine kinase